MKNSKTLEIYREGDVIASKYEVRGTLGKGGFGVVYRVYCRDTGEMCALKTFRDELLADPAARIAFKKEALLWVNLDKHPAILSADFVEEVSGRLFVKMEYIAPDRQGRVSLGDHLAGSGGPLGTNQALFWAIVFCLGMEHAKAHGIECHRDIKPANILVTPEGKLKIGDFGLASAAEVAWRVTGG
jgi:serine/threonine protein kinase